MGERDLQQILLERAVSEAGSGAARYGAAMFFYAQGEMPADMLEIYRCCSKFDHEDPIAVALYEGISLPVMLRQTASENAA